MNLQLPNCARSFRSEVFKRGWQNQYGFEHGDRLLSSESADEMLHSLLEALRKEGLTNDDIRAWWNLSPIERVLIELTDEYQRTNAYVELRKQLPPEEAATILCQRQVIYDTAAPCDGPNHRPLPFALKTRIDAYLTSHDPELLVMKTAMVKSLNAVIREEIRQGRL